MAACDYLNELKFIQIKYSAPQFSATVKGSVATTQVGALPSRQEVLENGAALEIRGLKCIMDH
jgi:hypothetical protein